MSDDDVRKAKGIRQIVSLKQLLNKWQTIALGPKDESSHEGRDNILKASSTGGIQPVVNKRLELLRESCESDEDSSCNSPQPPPDVPKGYVPVYVGPEQRRFVIPTTYLGLPVFKLLLEKAEEEFGFDHKGALTLPCEIETFKYILQVMEQHQKGLIDDEGNPTDVEE